MSAVLAAIVAHRAAYTAFTTAVGTHKSGSPAVIEAGANERAALDVVFAVPVSTMSEVSEKASYLLDEVDQITDYLQEDEITAMVMRSFLVPADTLATAIDAFRQEEAAEALLSDDEMSAYLKRQSFPAFHRLRDNPPAATTMAGVEAALQLMADEDAKDNDWLRDGFLERTILPFFKGKLAAPIVPDPFLERMVRYRVEADAYNSSQEDDGAPEPSSVLGDELAAGTLRIHSIRGAVEALRYVLASDTIGDMVDEAMVKAALAYLEKVQ